MLRILLALIHSFIQPRVFVARQRNLRTYLCAGALCVTYSYRAIAISCCLELSDFHHKAFWTFMRFLFLIEHWDIKLSQKEFVFSKINAKTLFNCFSFYFYATIKTRTSKNELQSENVNFLYHRASTQEKKNLAEGHWTFPAFQVTISPSPPTERLASKLRKALLRSCPWISLC